MYFSESDISLFLQVLFLLLVVAALSTVSFGAPVKVRPEDDLRDLKPESSYGFGYGLGHYGFPYGYGYPGKDLIILAYKTSMVLWRLWSPKRLFF